MAHPIKSTLAWVRRHLEIRNANKRRLALRIGKWTVAVVGGVWLLYIVTANIALQTRWARNFASSSPQVLQVDYASAWTAIPGIIHFSKGVCFGQFTGVEYRVELDHVRVNLVMLQLLRSHFVIHVNADGFGLRAKSPTSVNPAAPAIDAPIPLLPLEAPRRKG